MQDDQIEISGSLIDAFPILAKVLGVSQEELSCDCRSRYHSFEVKTRIRLKARTITAPCSHLKAFQRRLLAQILALAVPHDAAMAFVPGRSIAINAKRHHGADYLFQTDIKDFFDTVAEAEVGAMLSRRFPHLNQASLDEIEQLVLHQGRLPQGAPTSPHIANLVLQEFDEKCSWFCERLGAVYTRYADDISISSGDPETLLQLESVVREGLRALGLELHPGKARHLGPQHTRTVTGLDISGDVIRPTRAFRKKTKALVRMCERYPEEMVRHRDRIRGYLAFWHDVTPRDPELGNLLLRMGYPRWA